MSTTPVRPRRMERPVMGERVGVSGEVGRWGGGEGKEDGASTSVTCSPLHLLTCSSNIKRDPLRQRQFLRVIPRVCRSSHVSLPRIGSRLSSPARILLTAEGAADFGAAGADVDVGDSA